ncbi:hypothetical protein Cgig2_026873 [Carnegiea gigantea]|uniref:MSP domain-containing protein n=1 Tax=Carnegiea gigantea TaxID=171969 RepID=A0A9Q1QR46_9CARY|nr:hypothetical protein Cgig2_026873 [Carnegiea gigantea]
MMLLSVELEKQSFCDLKITNNTEQNVAFKHPIDFWNNNEIAVTLQAQREYPTDMQCRDKFLLQSTIVTPHSEVDDLPQDTFTKESGRVIEECKLRVVYVFPNSSEGNADGDSLDSSIRGLDVLGNLSAEDEPPQVLSQLLAMISIPYAWTVYCFVASAIV